MITLRDYQTRAINMLYEWVGAHPGNPCLVMPTGSGKSIVIAAFCEDVMRRWPASKILILSHVKELLEQDADKILLAWPSAPLGIYSAGLNCRDLDQAITVAGIQSIYRRASDVGRVDIVMVDECHLIGHKDSGMYRSFLDALREENPDIRIIGLTATPYRMGHGLITDPPALFDDLVKPVSISELVNRGFLAPLRSKLPRELLNVDGVHIRGGEYAADELQAAVNTPESNRAIVEEVIRRGEGRKAWLFFCAGVKHARNMAEELTRQGIAAGVVTGDTPSEERAQILEAFKAGRLQSVTNANVLTTGFDYPDIDLIAMCRPTLSPGLYSQIAGRGMRLKSQAADCLVLDFAGNVARHGPITAIVIPEGGRISKKKKQTKTCPDCDEIVAMQCRQCPSCGHVFTRAETRHSQVLTLHKDDDIMGLEPMFFECSGWRWSVQESRRTGTNMIKIEYMDSDILSSKSLSEYLCLLHGGFAQRKACARLARLVYCSTEFGAKFEEAETTEMSLAIQTLQNFKPKGPGDPIQCFTAAELLARKFPEEDALKTIAKIMNNATPPDSVSYVKEGKYPRVLDCLWPRRHTETAT